LNVRSEGSRGQADPPPVVANDFVVPGLKVISGSSLVALFEHLATLEAWAQLAAHPSACRKCRWGLPCALGRHLGEQARQMAEAITPPPPPPPPPWRDWGHTRKGDT
jgi:hypothetical protein